MGPGRLGHVRTFYRPYNNNNDNNNNDDNNDNDNNDNNNNNDDDDDNNKRPGHVRSPSRKTGPVAPKCLCFHRVEIPTTRVLY